ncbi:hypothetical protein CAPTEDRAFT_195097 [Capitella teleta]|uniref:Uncharacterized protein n=1 Tax=Capitella teleta TaxID=283909 RepID=R7UQ32_CAPTE|nr:hypothetical protein CAPTEDRAFT_195097 [Capitella teleta]|eukprot:ELU08310.1 hypothetical protein CAPTEDRAFT_195097 [Capitella teleta]
MSSAQPTKVGGKTSQSKTIGCRLKSRITGMQEFTKCVENKVAVNCNRGALTLVPYLVRASTALSEQCTEDLSDYTPVWGYDPKAPGQRSCDPVNKSSNLNSNSHLLLAGVSWWAWIMLRLYL